MKKKIAAGLAVSAVMTSTFAVRSTQDVPSPMPQTISVYPKFISSFGMCVTGLSALVKNKKKALRHDPARLMAKKVNLSIELKRSQPRPEAKTHENQRCRKRTVPVQTQ